MIIELNIGDVIQWDNRDSLLSFIEGPDIFTGIIIGYNPPVEVIGGVSTTYATYKVMASDGRICHVRRDVMTRVIND